MPNVNDSTLIELAIDLANSLTQEDRFERLLTNVRKTINCDAVVLLKTDADILIPLAQQGLTSEAMGRRFVIDDHPRFQHICRSPGPVCFPSDSPLPDPYDGMIAHHASLHVHACMGLPLYQNDELFGVLTLDSLTVSAFDAIPERTLAIISAMASATLKTAVLIQQLESHNRHTQAVVTELTNEGLKKDGGEMIGHSPLMEKLQNEISLVAPSDYAVLIQGETGVGKELVARLLHQRSNRAGGPLVYVNCAALPEQLVESELFGHVKGAFTGADKSRAGKFALANGGTLFLDEIGELPLNAQSKLLRALQSQEIQPVGQDQVEHVDVRVIAATNRDLQDEVTNSEFRADLYHRLSVFPLTVPALRDRVGDIALLSGFFAEQIRRSLGISSLVIGQPAQTILENYDWPGNVRELEHVIRRAALLARARADNQRSRSGQAPIVSINTADIEHLQPTGAANVIPLAADIPQPAPTHNEIIKLRDVTDTFQRQLILQALENNGGNWSAAARALTTDRANLARLARRLGLNVEKTVTKNH
ncbi:Regulatory protein LuxO [BD1-7 clade bacterium]|uniref:Regulatory protein LuxO n=1 Tax=BD1-7 clade bacterium TaxID=2029982 RepID=A0A5S9NWY0_9GAMM|nr:Regulatory protein LuxO [BD1-7 clade bacterium]CAA0095942.1 Regulatory protein LuxO [BD1-7 clade bacterium]